MARIIVAAKAGPVRKAIRGKLASEGHKVRCVDHGGDVCAALHEEPAELVVCDARLPVIDGVALMMMGRAANAPAAWKDVRFLLMSEDPDLAATLAMIEVAVDGMIAKPFSTQALCKEVQRLLPIRPRAA